jgi:predicted NodU family carbamoyl transferase
MGLAAYGDPARFRALFRAQWRATERGVEQAGDPAARAAVIELARFRRLATAPIEQDHRDIAAALQEALEDQVMHLARVARARTGEDRLCLAGGVALNSTANGVLARSGVFRELFIQPAASDAGTSLGAALLESHRALADRRPAAFSAYLGPAFSDAEIDAACARHAAEITIVRPADILDATVERLRAQHILGWFQGRMEYGPRALGNRSILADPRDPDIRDRINRAVKHREPFRPFAPAVLAEHAAACFAMDGLRESPFMLITVPARPERRAGFEAAIHRDDTSRIQTVTRDGNPRFHALLERFHAATGVPVLLNTSFNVNGEPIVCTPDDAIECLLSTELDALVLGDRIIERRPLDPDALRSLRPCLQDGVQLQTSIAVAAPGAAPEWRHTLVSRRHLQAEIAEDAAAVLLACDGQRSFDDLVDQLAPLGDGDRDQTARDLATLLERFLRLRFLRLA